MLTISIAFGFASGLGLYISFQATTLPGAALLAFFTGIIFMSGITMLVMEDFQHTIEEISTMVKEL